MVARVSGFSVFRTDNNQFVVGFDNGKECLNISRTFANAQAAADFLTCMGFRGVSPDAIEKEAPAPVARATQKPEPVKPKSTNKPKPIQKAHLENASKVFGVPVTDVKTLVASTRALQKDLELLKKRGLIKHDLGPTGADGRFGDYTTVAYNEAVALVMKANPKLKQSEIPAAIHALLK